ncbi:MAG: nucleoid-associated protein YgaU [Parasphingorhabdus sp.]|jgi:nucleoid-associated protein YgaU
MTNANSLSKAVIAAMLSAALLAGCASAKKVPDSAEAAPAPAPEAVAEPAAAPEPMAPAEDMHVVVSGEHLWGISSYSNIYSDPYKWPLIYKRNRDQINDADLIYPGQELAIRRDLKSHEITSAIKHAKMRGEWSLGVTEDADLDYLFE